MNAIPRFTVPTQPDVRPLLALHRSSDAHVAFTRHDAKGQFEPLFSVPAKDLAEVFPEFILHHVGVNSYATINGFHLTERRKQSRSGIEPRFPYAVRQAAMIRTLTACYVDIDCYTRGLTFGQAFGELVDAQDRGIVPPATMIQRSGRGLWALWFLQSRGMKDWPDDGPVRAWPEVVGTYTRIQLALGMKLRALGADANARDVSRVMRVAGSITTKSNERVGYWFQLRESDRQPYVYTIDELASLVGVRPTRIPPEIKRNVTPEARERGRRGWNQLWAGRVERVTSLIEHRGRTPEGCRNSSALILASCMFRTGASRADVEKSVYWFGRDKCEPPLRDDEIDAAIKEGKRLTRWSDYTIGEKLRVTDEESRVTGLKPQWARPLDEPQGWTRAEKKVRRRELIRHLVDQRGGEVPTVRELQEFIDEQTGERPGLGTVHRDLRELGLAGPGATEASTAPDLAMPNHPTEVE